MPSPNADRPTSTQNRVPSKQRGRRKARGAGRLMVERLFSTIPIHPFLTAAAVASVIILFVTIAEVATGRMDDILAPDDFDPYGYFQLLLHILLVFYMPAAFVTLVRSARRNAARLLPFVEPAEHVKQKLSKIGRYPQHWYLLAGFFGAVFLLMTPFFSTEVWRDHIYSPFAIEFYTIEVWGHRISELLIGFYGGVWIFASITEARRFSALARHVVRSAVFDPKSLVPFTQLGLTNVLNGVGIPVILSLFLFGSGLLYLVLGVGLLTLLVAIVGMIWPIQGIHRQIKNAKHEKLDWVNAELAREREVIVDGGGERFPQLMAYRSYIESIREWPLDGSTMTRLGFYLGIPAISWSGAALVERLIDSALG